MELKDVDKPTIQKPDDVIIKVLRSCVCGSDLWNFRGINPVEAEAENSGHEALGVVEEVGDEITTVKHLPTVVDTVLLVGPALMVLAKVTLTTSRLGCRLNTFASSTVNGHWSRFLVS